MAKLKNYLLKFQNFVTLSMAWHGMERERERDCDKQYTIPDFNVYQIKMNTMSFQAK